MLTCNNMPRTNVNAEIARITKLLQQIRQLNSVITKENIHITKNLEKQLSNLRKRRV